MPISRLTDADRKWMLNAEYGGSGGKPIETGMVVEEPDIEIGAGVSSKGEHLRLFAILPSSIIIRENCLMTIDVINHTLSICSVVLHFIIQ